MKKVFPEGTISVTYRRGKCLKELISPYPRTVTESASRVSKCNESRCDISRNYMMFKNEFTCTATGNTYNVRRDLTCRSDNIVLSEVVKSASNSMLTLLLIATLKAQPCK